MSQFVSGNAIHGELFGGIDPQVAVRDGWPFGVRVCLPQGRSPRHPYFEYTLEMGSGMIEDIMSGKPMVWQRSPDRVTLLLAFPERHMEPWEQQAFALCLAANPSKDRIECVDIITQCPLIIGSFLAASINIVTWPDEESTYRARRATVAELTRDMLEYKRLARTAR